MKYCGGENRISGMMTTQFLIYLFIQVLYMKTFLPRVKKDYYI